VSSSRSIRLAGRASSGCNRELGLTNPHDIERLAALVPVA
jgi:hypothetical protein